MSSKGKLIVFEGIDGCGGETQTQLITDYLKTKVQVVRMRYPDYNSPTGKFIDEYLHGKQDLSIETLVLLHTLDRLKDKDKINKLLEQGKTLILDRWFTSTLAFQAVQGFPLEKMLKIADLLDLPKPDKVVYLKISADTSMKRKLGEKGSLDKFEKDKKFLEAVVKQYDRLAKENVFGKWIVIDGEQTKENVFEEIKRVLKI